MFSFIHIFEQPKILNIPCVIKSNQRQRRQEKGLVKYSLKYNSIITDEFLQDLKNEQIKNQNG